MTRTIDLNTLEQPTLELTLRDPNRTLFRLIYPTVSVIERFKAAKNELQKVANTKSADSIKKLYELTAEMISCNADCVSVTAEDLRDVYNVSFTDLIFIFKAYLDFINDLEDIKN